MKNLSLRKNIAMLASVIGMTVVCGITAGCSKKSEEESPSLKEKMYAMAEAFDEKMTTDEISECHHLIVSFANQEVIFRECENLSITTKTHSSGYIDYYISEKGQDYIIEYIEYGMTDRYNYYVSSGESHDKMLEIEEKAIENGAYVYEIEE